MDVPTVSVSIALALRVLIQESGWTAYKIARVARVNHRSIYRFMRNERMLDLDTADRVLRALKATCKLEREAKT